MVFKFAIKYQPLSMLQMGIPVSLNTGMTRIVGMERVGDSLVLTNQKCVVRACDLSRVSSSRPVSLEVSREHFVCQGMVASVNAVSYTHLTLPTKRIV